MTLEELRQDCAVVAHQFDQLADSAEADDFAPWVVEALRRAANVAMAALTDERLAEARRALEERGVVLAAATNERSE